MSPKSTLLFPLTSVVVNCFVNSSPGIASVNSVEISFVAVTLFESPELLPKINIVFETPPESTSDWVMV